MSELRERLGRYLAERLPERTGLQVTEPRRLGGGASQENWSFDLQWRDDGEERSDELLLRREPPAGVVETTRKAEFELLRRLSSTPVPVAAAHWIDDGTVFGQPAMIVERRTGLAHRSVLANSDPLKIGEPARAQLAASLADLLAQVHRVDIDVLGLTEVFPVPLPDPATHELDYWEAELSRVELEPQPVLRMVVQWLRSHRPAPPQRLTLVHGDFRPANVLVRKGRIEVLLDWELAHLGDPADDLGWYTCSIYSREHFVPGSWEIDDFLARYADRSRTDGIEPDRLHFWQVMSTFRLAVMALTGVRNFCEQLTDRPAAPADRLVRQSLVDTGLAT